jgi:hypothetical protein
MARFESVVNLHHTPIAAVLHHHTTRVAGQAPRRFRGNARAVLERGLAGCILVGQHRDPCGGAGPSRRAAFPRKRPPDPHRRPARGLADTTPRVPPPEPARAGRRLGESVKRKIGGDNSERTRLYPKSDGQEINPQLLNRRTRAPSSARQSAWPPLLRASAGEHRGHASCTGFYFLSVAFFSAGALDADFAIDVVGTMMWAYGVPFHITHGPPLVQSVGYASS